uniref:Uncharacterized protein n=1 Tax=Rhizophora mucronata TaxID=61149 RepID=A0A2P2JXP9_RHIMU
MNKLPGWLPRPPALPASSTRIVSPVSTPAGTVTLISLMPSTTPEPLHTLQYSLPNE